MSDEESQAVEEENQESEYDVDPLSAEEIFHRKSCMRRYEIYKDFQHIKSDGTNGKLGSIGKFCAAFYHVPSTKNYSKCCLDEGNCKFGREDSLPRSVVALVKYEIEDGNGMIVRYSNHYIRDPDVTKHAEEFFSDDINDPENEALRSSISRKKLKKITMYITLQPCHLSTNRGPKKSCCGVLLKLKDSQLKNVEMCIKCTHIYKAGSRVEHAPLVKNGKEGIRLLMDKGIEITRMEEADWNFLYNLVAMNDDQRGRIPPYSISIRKVLDEETGKFLRDRKIELANSRCDPMHHCLVVNQNDVRYLFDNLFQLCAFFHVFEQGAENASLCLTQVCSTNGQQKPNIIVVKGTYQNGGEPYEAKYTDCHRFGIKAEQFLHYDAPGLSDNQRHERRGIMKGVTIYTTWLPRGFFKTVLPLTVCTLVEVSIKPSHLHGGDASPEDVAKEVVALKRNKYINAESMTKDDWIYLFSKLPEANRNSLPEYENSPRQHLDEEIERILKSYITGVAV